MIRARRRWHWLCRCTRLGQPELGSKNRPAAESRAVVLVMLATFSRLLALLLGIETAERLGKIHYPRAKRWRLNEYGWQCDVKTAPRTGRKEVVSNAAKKIINRNAFGMMWRPAVAAARTCGKGPADANAPPECGDACADPCTSSRPGPDSTTCGTSMRAR